MRKIKLEKLFYNNKWLTSNSKSFYKHRTYDGITIEIANCNQIDIKRAILSARSGLVKFSEYSNKKKSKILDIISKRIKNHANDLAKKECLELGKHFISAKKEILECAKLWKHASSLVKKKTKKVINKADFELLEVQEPIGVVALIIPWNFPMIVLSERLPYILGAGNSVIIKPSENGSLSIERFMKLTNNVGLPEGTINYLSGDFQTGKKLIKNQNISMISFTGSTKTGKEIYKNASYTIKRLSLELGGKNPMIVFADSNLHKTTRDVIYSFSHNAGQCCVSGSKLFIEKSFFSAFVQTLIDELNKLNLYQGISTVKQYNKIKKIILQLIKNKVPIVFRSEKLFDDEKRIIYPIIFNSEKKKDYLEEEIFGPVLLIIKFQDIDQLIRDINDTRFGLAALIWTKNKKKAMYLASKIKFGRIWINGNISQNFPELSIGGFKQSGLNRETGDSGLRTYSEIKSIIVNK